MGTFCSKGSGAAVRLTTGARFALAGLLMLLVADIVCLVGLLRVSGPGNDACAPLARERDAAFATWQTMSSSAQADRDAQRAAIGAIDLAMNNGCGALTGKNRQQ